MPGPISRTLSEEETAAAAMAASTTDLSTCGIMSGGPGGTEATRGVWLRLSAFLGRKV